MRVGIVDVGGNTARLLVAGGSARGLEHVADERAPLRLGAEIEHAGTISRAKLDETAETVERFLESARGARCAMTEVLITSPGRQSGNRDALARALERVAGNRVRFVSAHEEATLAYLGALACADHRATRVAVCDVGGGSTEIAVGIDATGPQWASSLDLGSLRIARRHFAALQPTKRELRTARKEIRRAIERLELPAHGVASALATGGTARAARKLVGSRLGSEELAQALAVATETKPRKVAERYGLPVWRAESLAAGVLLLAEVCRALGVPLAVSGGGLREGAALELLQRLARAA